MTNDRAIDLLKKNYPEIYKEIFQEDITRKFTLSYIEIIWLFSHQYQERTIIYIAVCLKLFSPSTITMNAKATYGLVNMMAEVKGVGASAISNKVKDAVFQYKNYKNINSIVDLMVDKISQI